MKQTRHAFSIIFLFGTLLMTALPASALIGRDDRLDAGFTLLEQGNPFIDRYNRITGANVEARYQYGIPYMWGGRSESMFLKIAEAQEDNGFFGIGERYVGGLDCIGLIRWIQRQTGRPELARLEELLRHPERYADNRLPLDAVPWGELHRYLCPGDYLIIRSRSSRHVMMYIGTLRHYGYDVGEAGPAMAPWLDHPLFLQSGSNHFHGPWYQQFIREKRYRHVSTTNGGVCVVIAGVPTENAPGFAAQNGGIRYFPLGSYDLVVYDVEKRLQFVWYRE